MMLSVLRKAFGQALTVTCSNRATGAIGGGLGDLKVHKSRLEREKEAWAQVRQSGSATLDASKEEC